MKSRRDLLKIFGAGILIAPIIGAKADESSAAQLIETPKIKPVELFAHIPKPITIDQGVRSAALLLECADGIRHRIEIEPDYAWGTINPGACVDIEFNTNTSPVGEVGYIRGVCANEMPHL